MIYRCALHIIKEEEDDFSFINSWYLKLPNNGINYRDKQSLYGIKMNWWKMRIKMTKETHIKFFYSFQKIWIASSSSFAHMLRTKGKSIVYTICISDISFLEKIFTTFVYFVLFFWRGRGREKKIRKVKFS